MNLNYGNPRKNPPLFNSTKNYEQWKKELEAWCKLTKEEPKDWAHLIALGCLSPEDPSGIRDKVFALDLDPDPGRAAAGDQPAVQPNPKAGYERLIAFMDNEFQKDNLTDMCEHIRVFMRMTKKKEQTMKAYISDFEAAYKKAKEKGLPAMPHKFMMWSLLESVHITDHEYMLVISAIPTDSPDMYEAAKTSLLKFFNNARSTGAQGTSDGVSMIHVWRLIMAEEHRDSAEAEEALGEVEEQCHLHGETQTLRRGSNNKMSRQINL